jgi:hypothetical protein
MDVNPYKAPKEMRYRLRTLLIVWPLYALVLAVYVLLQIEAIRVVRESNEFERAKRAAPQPWRMNVGRRLG